jgi:hypothetical protein
MTDREPVRAQQEPMPRPFGVVWEAFWKLRRRQGESWLPSLARSFFDARSCR